MGKPRTSRAILAKALLEDEILCVRCDASVCHCPRIRCDICGKVEYFDGGVGYFAATTRFRYEHFAYGANAQMSVMGAWLVT